MRSSIILTSLLATLALAKPLDKRYLTTKVEVYTVYTTVTMGAQTASHLGGRHRHRSSSAIAQSSAAGTTTDVVVPTYTPQPPASSSEAVPSSSEAPAPPSSEAPAPPSSKAPAPSSAPAPVSSAPAPSTPASSSAAPVMSNLGDYAQKILDQHNVHRANHTDTNPLTWSDQLTATALKIANSCVYAHDT
jgi:uncharacterized protein YkwD